MSGTKTSGNRTGRRGVKYRRNIALSRPAAQTLRVLTLNARSVRNRADVAEEQIVEELIEAAWQELDEQYRAGANEAYEGGVL